MNQASSNPVAITVGGLSGIGKEVAGQLLQDGVEVLLVWCPANRLYKQAWLQGLKPIDCKRVTPGLEAPAS